MLSLAALARRLDISQPRANTLLREGVLVPDARVGNTLLFAPERVSELRAQVRRGVSGRPRRVSVTC